MGGALALALRKAGAASILGCDRDRETLEAALGDGAVDEGFASPEAMLGRCDLIFLCINPQALLEFMERWMGAFRPGALITDIAGIKGGILRFLEEKLRPDLDFIPGHPMAGSEKGGYAYARNCDFQGKNYILTPLKRNTGEHLDFLKALIYRMGFGRITCTTAEDHDRKVAFTSHLCHVIASALIDCQEDPEIIRFGGGSFEDLTRIAMLNVPMWTEIFLENREALLEQIARFEESMDKLKGFIAGERKGELEAALTSVRNRRMPLEGILPEKKKED
jgi:prephenate dehydrogenase